MEKSFLLVTTILVVLGNEFSPPNYYWREYSGTIPPDAVIGGKDCDGTIVYIGQGYYPNRGLKPGRITPGVKEITVPWGQKNQLSYFNKILCGPQENFYWMKSNRTHLYLQLKNKHAVIGGHNDGYGYLSIGRVTSKGVVKIGKIESYREGNSPMYYVDGDCEKSATAYEILVYNQEISRCGLLIYNSVVV